MPKNEGNGSPLYGSNVDMEDLPKNREIGSEEEEEVESDSVKQEKCFFGFDRG